MPEMVIGLVAIVLEVVIGVLLGVWFFKLRKEEKELDKKRIKTEEDIKYAEVKAQGIIDTAKQKTNMIVNMEPKEFEDYLCSIFAQIVQVESLDINPKDTDALMKLVASVNVEFVKYLGEDMVAMIDTYYGTNYLFNWIAMKFRILDDTRLIGSLFDKTAYASDILSYLRKFNVSAK